VTSIAQPPRNSGTLAALAAALATALGVTLATALGVTLATALGSASTDAVVTVTGFGALALGHAHNNPATKATRRIIAAAYPAQIVAVISMLASDDEAIWNHLSRVRVGRRAAALLR
jgi:purine-cytosine permease-like protein